MSKPDYPITNAIRVLREKKIEFQPHQYEYVEKGGTHQTAEVLNVEEHSVIKTLIFEDDNSTPLIVLMHGDKEVSTKELARHTGAKRIVPCTAERAQKLTGYKFGGTSPFGTLKKMQVYAEKTIFQLDKIYINGGSRGFIVEIKPTDLRKAFDVDDVEVAINK